MALWEVETAVRLMAIGQTALVAVILARNWHRGTVARTGVILAIAVVGYLVTSSPVLRPAPGVAWAAAVAAANAAPFAIWAFGFALFEDTHIMPRRLLVLFSTVFTVHWVASVAFPLSDQLWLQVLHAVNRVAGLGAVGHAIYIAAVGRRDDLMERRRMLRPAFVILTAAQSLTILLVEVALGRQDGGAALSLLNVSVIATLTFAFALAFLGLRGDFLAPPKAAAANDDNAMPAADRALHRALVAHMDGGGYRETGLTIATLAETLAVPEHRLRKLINQRLGFRNFSTFLNGYRLAEAKALLADEAMARTPILTIAMDLGYGSLGPFNRAFKEATGMTPSEYRQRHTP